MEALNMFQVDFSKYLKNNCDQIMAIGVLGF